jgi:curved DNA-binding protein CbpA
MSDSFEDTDTENFVDNSDAAYKSLSNLPCLYSLFGLKPEDGKADNFETKLKQAYRTCVKRCKNDSGVVEPKNAKTLVMYTKIYEVLKNSQTRAEYDKRLEMENNTISDFAKLKAESRAELEALPQREATEDMRLAFKQQSDSIDRKMEYNPNDIKAYSEEEMSKRLKDLSESRKSQDDFVPENLFPGEFDAGKFHAMFDKVHKRDSHMTGIMEYGGAPKAFGGFSSGGFSSIGAAEGDEDDGPLYSRISTYDQMAPVSRADLEGLQAASYMTSHSDLPDDYYQEMEKKLKEYSSDTHRYNNFQPSDYLKEDPYAFSRDLPAMSYDMLPGGSE